MPPMATANPTRKVARSFPSCPRNHRASSAVKKVETETITPTLEAKVSVRAMFSSR